MPNKLVSHLPAIRSSIKSHIFSGIESTHSRLALALGLGLGLFCLSIPVLAEHTTPLPTNNKSASQIAEISSSVFAYRIAGESNDPTTPNGPTTFRIAGDRDNDGVLDNEDVDNDNDTIPDVYEGTRDSDNDGIPDRFDIDSDNDSIPDIAESVITLTELNLIDSNHDGVVDAGVAVGRNGLANIVELVLDAANLRSSLPDTDTDGVPDYRDLDSDNDGLSDRAEGRGLQSFVFAELTDFPDIDGNGHDDRMLHRAPRQLDRDNDGVDNSRDTDSDQDGLSDLWETAGREFDRDNNGRIDQFLDLDDNGYHDPLQGSPLQFRDSDNDGKANHLDLDSNNNGIFDLIEAGGIDRDNNGLVDDEGSLPDTEDDSQPANPPPDGNPNNDGSDSDISADGNNSPATDPTVLITGLDGNAHGGCSVAQSHLPRKPLQQIKITQNLSIQIGDPVLPGLVIISLLVLARKKQWPVSG